MDIYFNQGCLWNNIIPYYLKIITPKTTLTANRTQNKIHIFANNGCNLTSICQKDYSFVWLKLLYAFECLKKNSEVEFPFTKSKMCIVPTYQTNFRLIMAAAVFSETSVHVQQTTPSHTPENIRLTVWRLSVRENGVGVHFPLSGYSTNSYMWMN
jgi:hypothetical protein